MAWKSGPRSEKVGGGLIPLAYSDKSMACSGSVQLGWLGPLVGSASATLIRPPGTEAAEATPIPCSCPAFSSSPRAISSIALESSSVSPAGVEPTSPSSSMAPPLTL